MSFPNHKLDKDVSASYLLRSSGVLFFLILWESAPRLGWADPIFLPSFSSVLWTACELFREGSLISHLLVSLWRGALGLMVAAAISLPAGVLLGCRLPRAAEALNPLLRLLSQVNPFALLPVFVLFFGIGETAKIAVIAWVSLWPILFYTITGLRGVDPVQVKSAASMGILPMGILFRVLLPAAFPVIFTGVRISAGLVFFILMAAEMLGAHAGLGWLVHNSAMNYQVDRIYAGGLFIIVLGYLLNRSLILLERGFSIVEAPLPSGVASQTRFQPGRHFGAGMAALLLAVLIFGGCEVHRVNMEGKSLGGHADHSHHQMHSGPIRDTTPASQEELESLFRKD